jgi:hypothetical protein
MRMHGVCSFVVLCAGGAFNPPPPRQKIAKEREFIFLTRPAICLLGLNEINPSNKARWQLAQCTMHHAELNLEY